MTLTEHASRTAGDRDAGASEILARVLPVLQEAVRIGPEVTRDVVRAICHAQPAMASLWNACAAAAAEAREPGRFERAIVELLRAPAALRRVVAAAMSDLRLGVEVPRFVTLSYSGSVCTALVDAAAVGRIEVICAESRPRFEGRRLAVALARAGARVTVVGDAAAMSLVEGATGVLVGADAVTSSHWINKIGTYGVAAAARCVGTPVVVIASRDKLLSPELEGLLRLPSGPDEDLWADSPADIAVANPVFERVRLDWATMLVTDRGSVSPAEVASLIPSFEAGAAQLREWLS